MVRIAKERGGLCLSKEYKNLKSKLEWRCKNNHDFWMTPNKVIHRNAWCPRCTRYVSERICRGFFEGLFKESFPRAHPDWLTSSRGYGAELDGYCAGLKMAFEHNGEQHYRKVGHFHRNDHSFLQRKRDDARKLRQCGEQGVELFVVPHTVRYGEMEDFIRAEAARRNILVPRRTRVDWKNMDGIFDPGHLSRMQKIARDRNGLCLSKSYINNSTKLKWRCADGHEWNATPAHIAMGGWCPLCCGGNNPRSLEQMKALGKERGGECLSKVYRRNECRLRWRCALGHTWSAAPSGIIAGRWCPRCGGSQPRTIQDMRCLASTNLSGQRQP
jgi:ribosomal protein S27AE